MKLGIQTIIFGKRGSEDFPGVLRDIKTAGYDGVEFGYEASQTADEIKTLLSDNGLACAGYHAGYDHFKDLDAVRRHGEQLVAIGGKYMMCSGIEGWQKADQDAYKRSCAVFNAAADALKEVGATFCYHNHQWEFFDLGEGIKGIDLIVAETNPATVKFCIDVYWVACGGDDPAAFIRRHSDRAVYFHFKDGTFDAAEQKPLSFLELGRGQVDLKAALAAARDQNPDWIVTEQDRTEGDPAESARISADYAHDVLGI